MLVVPEVEVVKEEMIESDESGTGSETKRPQSLTAEVNGKVKGNVDVFCPQMQA